MTQLRNLPMPDDDTLVAAAEAQLRTPHDFGYSDPNLFVTHGFTFSRHRDSDVLGNSNFDCIAQDFYDTFGTDGNRWFKSQSSANGSRQPRDVYLTSAMAWDVGWREALTVRILRDADDDIYPGNITAAFACAVAVKLALQDYPVYDSADYSEREEAARQKMITENWNAVRERLWLDHDIDYADITDDDRAVFDAMLAAEEENSSEPWVNANQAADSIMAARSVLS